MCPMVSFAALFHKLYQGNSIEGAASYYSCFEWKGAVLSHSVVSDSL